MSQPEILKPQPDFSLVLGGPLYQLFRRTRLAGDTLNLLPSTYGLLASRYAASFDAKWLHGGAAPGEELLGSADIQSLADLGTSLGVVQDMRAVPFGLKDVLALALAAAVPLLPLALTVLSPEELLRQLVKVLL